METYEILAWCNQTLQGQLCRNMEMKPTILKKKSGENVEFYLVGREVTLLKSISLIGAFTEALLIEPDLDKTSWINEDNKTVPVVFII